MAQFEPKRKQASDFNKGNKYVDEVDSIQADMPNNIIESQLWTQALATNPIDNTDADNWGEASFEIKIMPDGTPQLKANNMKGKQGEQGEQGIKGNGISDTDISYSVSSIGTTPPTTGWQSTIPIVEKGNYLWTRTIFTYTEGEPKTSYTSTYQGLDGKDGGITVDSELSYQSQNPVQNSVITNALRDKANTKGDYAEMSVGYADNAAFADEAEYANEASQLGKDSIGGSITPIYLNNGRPIRCTRDIPYIMLNKNYTNTPTFYAPETLGTERQVLSVRNSTLGWSGDYPYITTYNVNDSNNTWYIKFKIPYAGRTFCMQGGTVTRVSDEQTINLPKAMANNRYILLITSERTSTTTTNTSIKELGYHAKTTTSFKKYMATGSNASNLEPSISWFAFGEVNSDL